MKYNLALATHLLGIESGARGRAYLTEAYNLYESMKQKVEAKTSSEYNSMLLMGILNNQGCIYHQLDMDAQASECLRRVHSVMLSKPGIQKFPRCHCFFLNIMLLKRSSIAAAA
jgi:hypothetical protein